MVPCGLKPFVGDGQSLYAEQFCAPIVYAGLSDAQDLGFVSGLRRDAAAALSRLMEGAITTGMGLS